MYEIKFYFAFEYALGKLEKNFFVCVFLCVETT
jgi:hypothetical protein